MLAGTRVAAHSTHCVAQAATSQHALSVAVHSGRTSHTEWRARVWSATEAGSQTSIGWLNLERLAGWQLWILLRQVEHQHAVQVNDPNSPCPGF